jgi:hypothetical protein
MPSLVVEVTAALRGCMIFTGNGLFQQNGLRILGSHLSPYIPNGLTEPPGREAWMKNAYFVRNAMFRHNRPTF